MRILIVDDERQLASSLAEYFEPDGIEAEIALDGKSGRQRLEEEPFDCLVTDLRMPGLDGMQLLRWVKEEGPDMPVIVISAHGEIRDAVEAMLALFREKRPTVVITAGMAGRPGSG